MTFGQLLFWIIVAVIAFYALRAGISILIVAIAVIVLYYIVGLISSPTTSQYVVPIGAPRMYEGFYNMEPFAGTDQQNGLGRNNENTYNPDPHGFSVDKDELYQQPGTKYFDIDEKIGTKIVLNTCGEHQ